jgi:hypothetical protein
MDGNIAECSLVELVEDPLISLLMKSDGVDRHSLELLFERVARERARDICSLSHQEAAPCATC